MSCNISVMQYLSVVQYFCLILQTYSCCNNGSGTGGIIEDLKLQFASLKAKVQDLERVNSKSGSLCYKNPKLY